MNYPPVNMREREETRRVQDTNNQLLGADVDKRRQSETLKPVPTKRFSMGVELSKLKGLAQLRSDFLGLNLQPADSSSIEDSNEEKEEEKVDLPELNLETLKSIQFALNNSILTQVESLNEETLSSYLEYLEYNYPLNPEDWTRLETGSRELIKDAPKLQVSSLQVHCENDKFLKKYLKARVYFFNSPSYFLETNYQENDGNIVFSSLGSLLTPGIPNPLLRIEVYKLSRKTNKDKLVSSTQLRLSEIPNNTQIMRVLDLNTTNTSGLTISFGNQKSNHLYLTGIDNLRE
ncbi:uncharacterized protein LOC111714226 [Eurytemora carolleeae]|uniref:uncharacterized protein LOC111714226 n=1 Tax=Eurytemora carolleeae TaxID=1294199 RepID=UPI000C761D42|nr:uncharacterized protein LOC111714226 [Eurytemora carolleeae]|eukprot:XP_023345056.1 uncharacterized protein LOC111714226 [Eurytemora affinis]